ncbi:MAG: hypothetical protein QOF18_2647 [Frankiaceae bacterium]|nr:hypothetical protein [Frankiaceae bacterium]
MGTRSVVGWLALLVVSAAACAGPSGTTDDFRHKVSRTAASIDSDVQTALLTAQLALRERLALPYAATTISQVEDDATSAQSTLDTRQPPTTAAHDLLQHADTVLQPAISALTDTRIALRARNIDQLPALIRRLQGANHDLEQLYQAVS